MSNSVFNVTEPDSNDSITLVVSPGGTVTPDKDIVKSYLSGRKSTDINVLTMKKVEVGHVNVVLDSLTYVGAEEDVEESSDMDEISYNLVNFRMDHDYTPFTSPEHKATLLGMQHVEVDELAQTLSLLEEGTLTTIPTTPAPPLVALPAKTPQAEPLTKITKIVKGKKQTIFVNNKQKAKMISTGLLKEKPGSETGLFKRPKPVVNKATAKTVTAPPLSKIAEVAAPLPSAEAELEKSPPPKTELAKSVEEEDDEMDEMFDESEEEEFEDDDNDSDFELEEELKVTMPIRKTRSRKKSESSRGRAAVKEKPKQRTPKKPEPEKSEAEPPKPAKLPSPPPPQPAVQEPKPPEKKPMPKKEKKPPKPMPDDFALFSTPDIIRRVGKEPASPDKPPPSPTLPSPPKPAKILPENRSKSDAVKVKRLSSDGRDKSPDKNRRLSLEVKKQDRRPSVDVKQVAKLDDQVSVQEFADTLSNSNGSIPDDQLEPLPSAEDIRAIIQNENTKSFTSNLVIPEPDMHGGGDAGPMNLEAGGLDLDQSILDNINTDLISEDILYQVAQSLVDNTDLQNAIDKSLDALDSGIPHGLTGNDSTMIPSMENVAGGLNSQPLHHESSAPIVAGSPVQAMIKPGTQIVRPDGRVVVIPPIERPTTRSRNRKRDSSPQSTTTPGPRQPKPTHKPLDDEHVSGNELDSSEEEVEEEDDEDESEDDPNKLWCICNQPHNNRFMICCDTCEEWYHGKCVNVTKAMGHMMEQEGREWICVYCKDNSLRRPKAAARRIRKASKTSTDSGGGSVKKIAGNSTSSSSSTTSLTAKEEKKPSATGCVVCGKPSRNSSIYCSDSCILKHAQGVEKVVVFDRKSGKLLSGNNAPSAANLDKWLAENPTYEVVRSANKNVANKHPNLMQSKLKLVKNAGNDGVSLAVQKKGVNVGVLQHSPKQPPSPSTPQQQQPQPHFTRIPKKSQSGTPSQTKLLSRNELPTPPPTTKTKHAQSPSTPKTSSTPAKPKLVQSKLTSTPVPSKDNKQPMPQKTPKARQAEISSQPKEENLRETVRKTFFDQLSNRLKKVDDLKLTEDELKGISNEIETQLYKCFGDTGQKYKNKYRSLIFNIKDIKNQTLWRRICEKAVNPYQLVRLSPDDLASQELALWREREAKHQLDMIKKSELEMLNCTRQYVFKTHKGEQVFEEDRPKDQLTEVISGLGADSTSPEKDEGEAGKGERDKKSSSSKNSRRDKSKDRSRGKSRDGSKSRKEKSDSKERKVHRRSSSHDRKKRSKSKERGSRHASRSHDKERDRDRHRRSSHKTSRYKKDDKTIGTERLDKKSKEILEQLVDKNIVPPLEDKLWKHVPQEDLIPNPTVESDSDHEPTSTVTIPTPPRSSEPDETVQSKIKGGLLDPATPDDKEERIKSPISPMAEPIWKGSINMVDVAQISITAHEVSGDCIGLGEELSQTLDIVGRISPETVWDYIGKMKSSNSKTISVIRLVATNMEERMPYLALYSYLSSRNRLGVVKSMTKAIKDFYILPLASHTPIPDPLLPLSGPGFEESRPALLLGVLVRDKKKRTADAPPITLPTPHKRVRVELATPAVIKPSTPPSSSRSYTPPPSRDPRVKLPVPLPVPPPPEVPEEVEDDMDEPYSPEDSDPDTMPESASSHLNAEDISNLLTGSVKSSSFLESGLNTQTFEPFSNKFDTIPGLEDPPSLMPSNSLELQRKMAELDQRIAAQKAEIDKVSQDLVSSATSDIGSSALRDIALPSDLQQILASIKTIVPKPDGADSQGENSNSSIPSLGTSDLTIPLMLPKLSSRPLVGASAMPKVDATIPLNLPKSKSKADHEKTSSVLSSLSEEDLIKKAEEMLAESEPTKRTKEGSFYGTPPKRQRTSSQIPGLSDD